LLTSSHGRVGLLCLGRVHVGDHFIDFRPHVLQRLDGTTRHIYLAPVDGGSVFLELRNNSKQELKLYRNLRIALCKALSLYILTLASSVQAVALPSEVVAASLPGILNCLAVGLLVGVEGVEQNQGLR
jgi:hypothetical protein